MGNIFIRKYSPSLRGKFGFMQDFNTTNPRWKLTQDYAPPVREHAAIYDARGGDVIEKLRTLLRGRDVDFGPNVKNVRIQVMERPIGDRIEHAVGREYGERGGTPTHGINSIQTGGPRSNALGAYLDFKHSVLRAGKTLMDNANEFAVASWEDNNDVTHSHLFVNTITPRWDTQKERWTGKPKWTSPTTAQANDFLYLTGPSPHQSCVNQRFDPHVAQQFTENWCHNALTPHVHTPFGTL